MKTLLRTALLTSALWAQAPSFEAATIKPAAQGRTGSGINIQAARIHVMNSTLKSCVQMAYDVKDFQVAGGPNWVDSDRFDIDAVAARPFETGEYRLMLQTLLKERFDVDFHRETKERQGYALVVGKSGPKLPPPGDNKSVMFSRTSTGDVTLTAHSVSMAKLSSALSSYLSAIVVDSTKLDGEFDVALQWTPDPSNRMLVNKAGEPMPPPPSDAMPGPSIFTVLQEKLGLKLETRKVPVEVIVIDHAEHPTGN